MADRISPLCPPRNTLGKTPLREAVPAPVLAPSEPSHPVNPQEKHCGSSLPIRAFMRGMQQRTTCLGEDRAKSRVEGKVVKCAPVETEIQRRMT